MCIRFATDMTSSIRGHMTIVFVLNAYASYETTGELEKISKPHYQSPWFRWVVALRGICAMEGCVYSAVKHGY